MVGFGQAQRWFIVLALTQNWQKLKDIKAVDIYACFSMDASLHGLKSQGRGSRKWLIQIK